MATIKEIYSFLYKNQPVLQSGGTNCMCNVQILPRL